VKRAVALIETDFLASMQSASERADQLSRFATYFGDASLVNEQVDRYRAVTVDDVNRFVRERLGPENRVSLVFVPKDNADDGAELAGTASAAEG
jgi:predicted Zn-dependent peptidase